MADTTSTGNDTIKMNKGVPMGDSLRADTATADTSKTAAMERELGIRISKDALPAVVKTVSRDSAVLDMEHDVFYLYGKAQVNYEDLQLNAGEVSYTQASNIVTAAPSAAERDTAKERPSFKQGSERFTYDSMQYNFRSKRAIVRNAATQYGEGFIHSEQVKRNPDQTIYGWHSVYTTCALDTPHFGIRARKQKIIPGRVVVSGSANLEIEGVPTPLYLPFGIFPSSQKQRSGFILPTYTMEQARGFGLLNGGYYFYVNDKVDAYAQTNIYAKGSYAIAATSNYNNLYHYRGAFRLSYAYNKTGEDFEPNASVTKDFMVNWQHTSDEKSVPGQTFNASVQAGTSSFYANNSYDPNQVLRNQYQSNITYSKNWQNRPFGLTISALHNQNTGTKEISVTLPAMNFFVNQFNLFQNKNAVGDHWYDKITASYSADVRNQTTFYDSTFNLATLALSSFQNGIRHSIPVSASYTVARYVNMSFSVNYNEYWYSNRLIRGFNDATMRIDSTRSTGFFAARDFNAGVNFSTRIYGMKMFRHGALRGIRHVLTPNAGFTYRPDFADAPFNYYYDARLDTSQRRDILSPYQGSVVGLPPVGKAASVGFGLNNNLQIKVRSAKDTASGYKNVTLIDGLSVAGAYNAAADSFRWSDLGVNFRTNVLDKVNISAAAVYSPYAIDKGTGRILQTTNLEQGTGIGRFRTANMSLGTNFHSKPKGGANSPTNSQEYARVMRNAGYMEYVDFNIPWSFNINYTLSADSRYSPYSYDDTVTISHSFTFNSELRITERWKLAISSGYNFDLKELTLTSIDLYRDLHCWQMHFFAFPFGPRKSFNFTLNVKSTVLQDLKLVRRRDFRDLPN
ncbi:putative LPS assembly protein LptD [Nemorincola caseinilytica]|uniref:LPS assembly protein LptD n=1 Tax=Nemorincola caseinilytica TaxID=2054315 RepID=A0ABP8NFB8_9BACT